MAKYDFVNVIGQIINLTQNINDNVFTTMDFAEALENGPDGDVIWNYTADLPVIEESAYLVIKYAKDLYYAVPRNPRKSYSLLEDNLRQLIEETITYLRKAKNRDFQDVLKANGNLGRGISSGMKGMERNIKLLQRAAQAVIKQSKDQLAIFDLQANDKFTNAELSVEVITSIARDISDLLGSACQSFGSEELAITRGINAAVEEIYDTGREFFEADSAKEKSVKYNRFYRACKTNHQTLLNGMLELEQLRQGTRNPDAWDPRDLIDELSDLSLQIKSARLNESRRALRRHF